MGELLKFLGWGLFYVYNDGEKTQKRGGCLMLTILLVGGGLLFLLQEFLKSNLISKEVKDVVVTILMIILVPLGIFCLWKFIKYSIEAEREKRP